MSIQKYRGVAVALVGIILTGCVASKPVSRNDLVTDKSQLDPALHAFPADVKPVTMPEQIDYQLGLKDRGLYLSNLSDIKLLDPASCTTEVVGHRGYYKRPENSITAIRHGLLAGNDTIEIDVMRLRDGNWVLHHDLVTGRASGRSDGKRVLLSAATAQDWAYVHVRDPITGEIKADEWAPYLTTVLDEFKRFATPHQQLNIELKSKASESALAALDQYVQKIIGKRYYYSSLNLKTLAAVRAINADVYLGFIQKPHNKSIQALKKKARNNARNDPDYLKYKVEIEWGGRIGQRYYNKRNSDWTSAGSLDLIKRKIGANSGLHLDIRRFSETPNVLQRAHYRGMRVQTYSINGTEYHHRVLARVADKNRIPDAVISDSSPYKVCQRLYGMFEPQGLYQPKHALGVLLSQLPADADLEQIVDQTGYVFEGLYIRTDGQIAELPQLQRFVKAKSKKHSSGGGMPAKIRDDVLDLNTGAAVRIDLKRAM